MAIKSADQITIVDVTDAYSIMLTSEAFVFTGEADGIPSGASCTTQAVAFCGTNVCQKITIGSIICPKGVNSSVQNNGTSNPEITFTTTETLSTSCEATIPVIVDGVTVNKKFTFAIALKGSQGIQGLQGPKGEQGIPGPKGEAGETGTAGKTSYFHIKYSAVPNPTQSSQMTETPSTYIGTYVDFTETDSTDPQAYTWSRFVGAQGEKGENGIPGENGINGKTSYLHIAYANNSTGTSGFSTTDAAGKLYIGQYTDFVQADSTDPSKYSWTKIKGETGDKGPTGPTGDPGQDAITITITSSNGTIFKNNTGTTVLTAHVFKGAIEQTITDAGVCGSLGSIKWYKQGSTTAIKTSKTLTVSASDVTNSVVYTAQLEQ